ncbi:MAG TPA: N-acetylmuramoyl-L-alanine amidase [Verrucomicrobiae bacterium]|nr:N-acetylmuramoyl-L-alanine amidase [Verrucomicrobiae bacterium]
MSQKRVATVLASLVGTLTLSAGVLLLLEGGGGSTPLAAAFTSEPLAAQLATDVPLQEGAWEYIIVYESEDLAGSSASLADGRVTGGADLPPHTVRPKANFHFVIDSAQSGRQNSDGHLEVGSSWLNQQVGAPNAGWPDSRYHQIPPYTNAVGVCLISDLNRAPVSAAQHQRLVQVLRDLQQRLHIPKSHIYFQWELGPNAIHASLTQKAYADTVRSSLE